MPRRISKADKQKALFLAAARAHDQLKRSAKLYGNLDNPIVRRWLHLFERRYRDWKYQEI